MYAVLAMLAMSTSWASLSVSSINKSATLSISSEGGVPGAGPIGVDGAGPIGVVGALSPTASWVLGLLAGLDSARSIRDLPASVLSNSALIRLLQFSLWGL